MQIIKNKKSSGEVQQTIGKWVIGILVFALVLIAILNFNGINFLKFLPDFNSSVGPGPIVPDEDLPVVEPCKILRANLVGASSSNEGELPRKIIDAGQSFRAIVFTTDACKGNISYLLVKFFKEGVSNSVPFKEIKYSLTDTDKVSNTIFFPAENSMVLSRVDSLGVFSLSFSIVGLDKKVISVSYADSLLEVKSGSFGLLT